jgi:hypothetical protein
MVQRWMWIAWPAFLMAGVLEILVFSMVDPQELLWFGRPLELSREGIYTLGFFGFWGITAISSTLTALLAQSPEQVNPCLFPSEARHESCVQQTSSALTSIEIDPPQKDR